MVIKFVLGCCIVAFSSFIGYLLAGKYRQRKLFFKQYREFNERFLSEITYYKRPLGEFLTKVHYKGEFQTLLQDFYTFLKQSLTSDQALNLSEYTFLTKEEIATLEDYFQMLGKGDSISQKSYFSAMKEDIQKFYLSAENAYKKYADLYIKLGFLCGLMIVILLI